MQSLAPMRGEDGNPGFGMRSVSIAGVPAFGERGTVESFNAAVYHFPAQKVTIAWTGNTSRVPMDTILDAVTALVFNKRPPATR